MPLATIYSPDDAPLDTDPDKSDHRSRTPMSSSAGNSVVSGSTSSAPQHPNHNKDGNHPQRERGDRDHLNYHRSTTPVRLGMGVSEKDISTLGASVTPTRFLYEHTQSDHSLLFSASSNGNATATSNHNHNNIASLKSTSKQQTNQSSINSSSSSSNKNSSSTNNLNHNHNHNHNPNISKSNSNSSSNFHSYQIGDDSLSTHLLGEGTAIPSSSSSTSSPNADTATSVSGGSSSQSSPLARIKRRSMSHSDLPSLSDVALAITSSSSSSSSSNVKEPPNVGGSAVVSAAVSSVPSSSSARGPGPQGGTLYSGSGIHSGSKQHLLDVNWSVDPLSSSSGAAAAVAVQSSSVRGTVPVTHPLNTPSQLFLSTHSVNTSDQHTFTITFINALSQHSSSAHPLNIPPQHTLITHHVHTHSPHTLFNIGARAVSR